MDVTLSGQPVALFSRLFLSIKDVSMTINNAGRRLVALWAASFLHAAHVKCRFNREMKKKEEKEKNIHQICRRMWRGGTCEFAGVFFRGE